MQYQPDKRGPMRPAHSPKTTAALAAALVLLASTPALAVPAFARKYGTACTTCHTVFPKLNPFGEQFRRNGYRFPGVDSDYIKRDQLAMGNENYKKVFPKAVWPSSLPNYVPIAVGFNGDAVVHPDKNSSGGKADNGTVFSLQNLVEEGHIWAGGSLTDSTTFFAELTAADGGIELEHAYLWFNDLLGPAHAVNVVVGDAPPLLTSFGPHSSYIADAAVTPLGVTAAFGGQTDPWVLMSSTPRVELNGVVNKRIDYSVGLNAGATDGIHDSEDAYAHVGFKLGGMSLDGDPNEQPDPTRPWAENALTFDVFGSRSVSNFTDATGAGQVDTAYAAGGALRAQWQSLELDTGWEFEHHDHAAGATAVKAFNQWNELSYVVFPWLVPAVRVEYIDLVPDGAPAVSDLRILPGVAMLIYANVKVTVIGDLERAKGAPDGGWGAVDGVAAPPSPSSKVGLEAEAINIGLEYAY